VDERHNVITAEDRKQALESHGGLRDCRAEVDATNAIGNDSKIPGIRVIDNFLFEDGGIRTWKACNVWPAHYLAYDEQSFEKRGDTGLKVIQPFSTRMKERGTVLESTSPSTEIFYCSETGRVFTFETEAEADAHMDLGQHVRKLESESGYDTIRKKWAEKIFDVSVASREDETSPAFHHRPSSSNMEEHRPKGLAPKTTKRPSWMTDCVKAYLEQVWHKISKRIQFRYPIKWSSFKTRMETFCSVQRSGEQHNRYAVFSQGYQEYSGEGKQSGASERSQRIKFQRKT